MRLREIIERLGAAKLKGRWGDFQVKGLSCDSRDVRGDFIFVAVKGTRVDGSSFIQEAIAKGARVVVRRRSSGGETDSQKTLFIEVEDERQALARLAATFYGRPSLKLKTVGITGTNGKTTVSFLLEAMLKRWKRNPAVIGTINYRFNKKVFASSNTTPAAVTIQRLLAQMCQAKVDYALMEVSSHALDQQRVAEVKFYAGIFTNFTQDHLDYHKTIEEYFQAKAKLFRGLSPACRAIVNNDDRFCARISRLTRARLFSYGIERPSWLMAEQLRLSLRHSEFVLRLEGRQLGRMKTPLIGRHNIYNILAASAFALEEGMGFSLLKAAVEEFAAVPGRLERISCPAGFNIFVDYAHTEDALRNAIGALRFASAKPGRILVVFGCGGERDRLKRPKMGRVVSQMADYAIITNDNPRSEDPLRIIKDIRRGIKGSNYCVIPDRQEAISRSLSLAKEGDIVLVAGKGHEACQILKDKVIPFDDRQVIRRCLRSRNY